MLTTPVRVDALGVRSQVAEEVETQLQRYRAAVDEINKKTAAHAGQEGAFDPDDLLRRNTQNLMQAVSSLPELQEQKKVGWAGAHLTHTPAAHARCRIANLTFALLIQLLALTCQP